MTDHELQIVQRAIAGEVGKLVAVANERIDAKNAEIQSLQSRLDIALKALGAVTPLLRMAVDHFHNCGDCEDCLKESVITEEWEAWEGADDIIKAAEAIEKVRPND